MGSAAEHACYVYGIVPEDVEADPAARGVGDPPGRIRLVRHGDIAAMVSDISSARPPREPADLRAHRDMLDAAAAEVPVLPVPFGLVVPDTDTLIGQLLEPHHDEFAAALRELDGHAEYVIEARLDGADGGGGAPDPDPDSVRSEILDAVAGYCADTRVRGPSAAESGDRPGADDAAADGAADDGAAYADGADVAVLIPTASEADLERTVAELGRSWDGRVSLRLRGPLAPYDFVADLTTPA